jgi:hypothetical protein
MSLLLEAKEYACFNNVLNEVCNGFAVPDFSNRIGIAARRPMTCSKLSRISLLAAASLN